MQDVSDSSTNSRGVGKSAEITLFDIAVTLRRHWGKIVLWTALVTVVSAVYYLTRSAVHRAEIVLDVSEYEILYYPRLEYPLYQHEKLAKSGAVLDRVKRRMVAEGLLKGDADLAGGIIGAKDLGRKTDRVMISAEMPSETGSLRALEIWSEEYKSVVPVYRAKKLIGEQARGAMEQTRMKREDTAVLDSLRRQLTAAEQSGHRDDLRQLGIRSKIIELEGALAAKMHIGEFALQVLTNLEEIAGQDFFDQPENLDADSQDAREVALLMARAGLEEMFSRPVPVVEPVRTTAKIAAMFITGLIFASTAVVFLEWIRAPGACKPTGTTC